MKDRSSSSMKRYLGSPTLENFKTDFSFLLDIIAKSYGEYDLQLRDGYVNVYYKGNSMAKISPLLRTKEYKFEVHHKFGLQDAILSLEDERFSALSYDRSDRYDVVTVPKEIVHPFFQKKIIEKLCRRIEQVNYGEEIAFEQSLITDNLGRKDLLIIDRQVTGEVICGRLDLLALRRLQEGTYRFLILEVKLGNNQDLSDKVNSQIKGYIEAITCNIDSFKECYEKNYREKHLLGLFSHEPWVDMPDTIAIDTEVEGKILVGFYSRMAEKQKLTLIDKHPDLDGDVQIFRNKIEVNK